jgi:4-amino-4-deoxy-L-arabinose transferase-like glycosyltransferase
MIGENSSVELTEGSSIQLDRTGQSGKPKYQLLFLLLIYVLVRWGIFFTIGSPIVGWRPSDMASIALNYYRNGFHFLYPQVLWGGSGPGYVEMEFPLLPFLTGVLYKLFGHHDYLCLVLPYLSGLGLVWLTYRLGCYWFDRRVGLAAGLVASVVPTLIMQTTTGLWPDPPMVFFVTLGMYLVILWVEKDRWPYLAFGICSISLAILLKLTALFTGFPLLYLFIRKYGSTWWRESLVWITAIFVLLPPMLWYLHAYHLYTEYKNTFGILTAGFSKFGTFSLLTDPRFYARTIRRVLLYHFTPIGSIGFLYGIWVSIHRRTNVLMLVWLLAIAMYVIVAARGVNEGHYQYLLPILPVGAVFSGMGMLSLLARIQSAYNLRNNRLQWYLVACVLILLFGSNVVGTVHLFEVKDQAYNSTVWKKKKLTGLLVKNMTPANSLLIVTDTEMDRETPETSMTPPDVFFFSDRRGWYLSMAWLSVQRIEQLRKEGAQYFVVSGESVFDFKERRPHLVDYLAGRYKILLDTSDGIVYDLTMSP